MKLQCAGFILAWLGLSVCHTTLAQQPQPAAGKPSIGPASAPEASQAVDPRKDPGCQRRFDAAYGPEAARTEASPSKVDDGELAEKLAAAAAAETGDPGYQVYLYDKACVFGLRLARTAPLVKDIIGKLDALAPMQRSCWEEYRLGICRQMQLTAPAADRTRLGEEFVVQSIIVGDLRAEAGKWDEAAEQYQQAAQVASAVKSQRKQAATEKLTQVTRMKEVLALRKRLDQQPDNAKLRTSVIDAYLGLTDDPAGAGEILNPAVGESYCTYIPQASRNPAELPSGALLELGNWYNTLARPATAAAKPTLVRRMRDYYLAHIEKLRTEGATVAAVQTALAKINAGLREVGQDRLLDHGLFRDPAVQISFKKAIQWLWQMQADDGAWVTSRVADLTGVNTLAPTSIVAAALLGGGASVIDPRIAKTLRWLEQDNTTNTDGMSFRCLVFQEVQKQKPGRGAQILSRDMSALVRGAVQGGYAPTLENRERILPMPIHSWPPPLAVEAAELSGPKAPRIYWQQVEAFWVGQQRSDGGFTYEVLKDGQRISTVYNTIVGAGTLAVALSHLYGSEAIKKPADAHCESLARALVFLDTNFTNVSDLRPIDVSTLKKLANQNTYPDGSAPEYIMHAQAAYMLSQLGLATGRETFGKVRWWDDASKYVVSQQRADGSWGNIEDTALVILYMLNGYKYEQAYQKSLPALLLEDKPSSTKTPSKKPESNSSQSAASAKQKAKADAEATEALRLLRVKESNLIRQAKAQPGNKAVAEQLVRLHVVELCEPEKALEFADNTGNFMIKRLIKLLNTDSNIMYGCELLSMADWQMELAEGAPVSGRKASLAKAVACYEKFLARKPAIPAEAVRARALLESARAALAIMEAK